MSSMAGQCRQPEPRHVKRRRTGHSRRGSCGPTKLVTSRGQSLVSIELKHLRYAEVAERCGSFRKAADLLALRQSNLSRRVKHLEEQLGVDPVGMDQRAGLAIVGLIDRVDRQRDAMSEQRLTAVAVERHKPV